MVIRSGPIRGGPMVGGSILSTVTLLFFNPESLLNGSLPLQTIVNVLVLGVRLCSYMYKINVHELTTLHDYHGDVVF